MNEAVNERRQTPRHRVLKQGRLAFDGGGAVDCTVRNLSDSGARIEIASPAGLPKVFNLMIPADKFNRRGHLVWIHDNRIGIVFE